ncbi:vacuolar sorting protein [Polychaeton citri CBS 116435]|uniref:Vacuolar sorting protein n=1 Tax=Polychaeton citri CBS 116435 TaxID=1314669 RepID=A0A9P4UJW0_9PEZI|nr:vacuolar sorting protein [Polychaeton citri CBS 116435]
MTKSGPSGVFDVTALKNLQPNKHLELLDVIDNLRAQGLNEHVDLPQLIVCGDQSSGKSSLLSAISGVPFPKKESLCTRFATEVVLRRDDSISESQLSVTITPSSTRPAADRHELESFARQLHSMEDLPKTMTDAAMAMGLGAVGGAFSADILRLEVRGPNLPQLTIVDLPGLIHAENKLQSADDITLVNRLVKEYMSQERSIILAVVSAKYDYANQIVLTRAREVDPKGRRTLGIITKPDTLHPGSESEESFLGLAQNQDIRFSLGWHVVRNQDSNEPAESDRDDIEYRFFKASRLNVLSESDRGIRSLRDRLSKVLFEQIKRELPGLISEILIATEETTKQLDRMGRSRSSSLEKRMFVMELGQKFSDLCHAACEGLYEHSFFEETSSSTAFRRLRAVVQNANSHFARKLLELPLQNPIALGNQDVAGSDPTSLVERAKTLIRSYRGKELPGTFNPILIGQLFRELSRPWFQHSRAHVNSVWLSARTTVLSILEVVAEDQVRDACMRSVIDLELEEMQKAAEERLNEYMQEFRRQPITYNHYLTETVQAVRYERERDEATARCQKLLETRRQLTLLDVRLIVDTLVQRREPNMDNLAAQDLADYTKAYYKVALKRAIDEIPAHVIEPAILTRLPKLLDSTKILGMSDDVVDTIGGESASRTALRETLQAKLDVFDRSSLICKVYAERAAEADESIFDTSDGSHVVVSDDEDESDYVCEEPAVDMPQETAEEETQAYAEKEIQAYAEVLDIPIIDVVGSKKKKSKKSSRTLGFTD